MPNYLIIDTSDGRTIEAGGKVIRDAADEKQALAALLAHDGYRFEAKYVVFDLSAGVEINTEQARSVALLDANDKTGATVLATYDEAALEALKADRAVLKDARRSA